MPSTPSLYSRTLSGKENGWGFVSVQASASLHRTLQSSRPPALGAAAFASQAGTRTCSRIAGEGWPGATCSCSCRDLYRRRRTHGAAQGSGDRNKDPRLRRPDWQSSGAAEVTRWESGTALVSSVSLAGHGPHRGMPVLLPPARVPVAARHSAGPWDSTVCPANTAAK